MRFSNRQHTYYCGIDLPVKTMYVCILDGAGLVLVHRNVPSTPTAFLEIVKPYREDLVVAAECMFTWYWLADICAAEALAFPCDAAPPPSLETTDALRRHRPFDEAGTRARLSFSAASGARARTPPRGA